MRFYEIQGSISKIDLESGYGGDAETAREYVTNSEFRLQIQTATDKFIQKSKKRTFLSLSMASSRNFTICACQNGKEDLLQESDDYLRSSGIHVKELSMTEITFDTFRHLLRNADRYRFIQDDDETLSKIGLQEALQAFRFSGLDEEIVESLTSKSADRACNKLLTSDDLKAELDRIRIPKRIDAASGHPVHYLIETDDDETKARTCEIILSALINNGRLSSKRTCTLEPTIILKRFHPEKVFETCKEATVIVSLGHTPDLEDDHADSIFSFLAEVCRSARMHRSDVLTIFQLPKECTQLKSYIFERLGTLSFVEIKERPADYKRARRLLRTLAKEDQAEVDERLFSKLERDETYLTSELKSMYEEWFGEKLRTDIYPQYENFAMARSEEANEKPKGSAYEELMSMVGLAEAKRIINQAISFHKLQKFLTSKDMARERPSMHMAFTGSPGTAKTTVARLFARIMRENELLSSGHIVEVGRADLIGKYVGHTVPQVKKCFEKAMGGVLFIDEAYSLIDDRNNSFGDEAIDAIVQEMENNRDKVVVIFAGYTDEMKHFLDRNPGLKSRVSFHVPFPDYTAEELCQIAETMASKKGMRVSDDANEKLMNVFEAARSEGNFGNGRFARSTIEQAMMTQASRIVSSNMEELAKSELITLKAEDFDDTKSNPKHRQCVGFCV